MTSAITTSGRPTEPDTIVWESSAILHACRSDRADVLLHLADALSSTPLRHVTTAAVAEELQDEGLLAAP